MSLEQRLGEPADPRSDIYALSCVFFACLSGRPPFEGDTAAGTILLHIQKEPDYSLLDSPVSLPFQVQLWTMEGYAWTR